MIKNQVVLPFEGRDTILRLPKDWTVISELSPNHAPKLEKISKALVDGLEGPIGCAPLGRGRLAGKKIVLVVDDISRPTPTHLFFRDLLNYLLQHGAAKDDMLIVTALGVHRDMTEDELGRKLGRENIKGIRWINHNWRDKDQQTELGITKRGTVVRLNSCLKDADLILCIGMIEPHPLLGFGGGLKMILPGLAHDETIRENHMQGVSAEKFNYIGSCESPMRLDLEEGVLMLNKEIFIMYVNNSNNALNEHVNNFMDQMKQHCFICYF